MIDPIRNSGQYFPTISVTDSLAENRCAYICGIAIESDQIVRQNTKAITVTYLIPFFSRTSSPLP